MGNTPPKDREISQGQRFYTLRLEAGGPSCISYMKTFLFCLSGFYNQCVDILLACECQHCAYLYYCWSIFNVFRTRMCSIFPLMSQGQYFPIHSLESRDCIVQHDLGKSLGPPLGGVRIHYHPCCKTRPQKGEGGQHLWSA